MSAIATTTITIPIPAYAKAGSPVDGCATGFSVKVTILAAPATTMMFVWLSEMYPVADASTE